jgi:ribosomal protein S18 acetylase RimI-like enzyme
MASSTPARFHWVDLTIRDAGQADHPRAARLLSLAYAEYLRFGDEEPGWVEYVSNEVPDISSRSEDTLIVAENGSGELLACVTYVAPGRSPVTKQGLPVEWAVIRLLAVDPGARRRGLGRSLTEECIARARRDGARVVGLHTVTEMEVAHGLYERMGFVRDPRYDQQSGRVRILAFGLDLDHES